MLVFSRPKAVANMEASVVVTSEAGTIGIIRSDGVGFKRQEDIESGTPLIQTGGWSSQSSQKCISGPLRAALRLIKRSLS
jgi:hypothetical protein